MENKLKINDKVTDQDGFTGTIINKVTTFPGFSFWYEVRFNSGVAVRYESDLRLEVAA